MIKNEVMYVYDFHGHLPLIESSPWDKGQANHLGHQNLPSQSFSRYPYTDQPHRKDDQLNGMHAVPTGNRTQAHRLITRHTNHYTLKDKHAGKTLLQNVHSIKATVKLLPILLFLFLVLQFKRKFFSQLICE